MLTSHTVQEGRDGSLAIPVTSVMPVAVHRHGVLEGSIRSVDRRRGEQDTRVRSVRELCRPEQRTTRELNIQSLA